MTQPRHADLVSSFGNDGRHVIRSPLTAAIARPSVTTPTTPPHASAALEQIAACSTSLWTWRAPAVGKRTQSCSPVASDSLMAAPYKRILPACTTLCCAVGTAGFSTPADAGGRAGGKHVVCITAAVCVCLVLLPALAAVITARAVWLAMWLAVWLAVHRVAR